VYTAEGPQQKFYPIFDRKPIIQPPTVHEIDDDDVTGIADVVAKIQPEHLSQGTSPPSSPLSEMDYIAQSSSSPTSGGSRNDPIILDLSPIKPMTPLQSETRRLEDAPIPIQARKPKRHPFTSSDTSSFPSAELQHIRGPQSTFSSPASPFQLSNKQTQLTECVTSNTTPNTLLTRHWTRDVPARSGSTRSPLTASEKEDYASSISRDLPLHPAVSRLLDNAASSTSEEVETTPSQMTWADKWRPNRADQVLGNEQNAIYLKEWLRALALQSETSAPPSQPTQNRKSKGKANKNDKGNKRPRVVRAVEKKKGRKRLRIYSDEDDWIVDDDEISEAGADEDEPEFEPPLQPPIEKRYIQNGASSPIRLTSDTLPGSNIPGPCIKFGESLTNTILLVGPPGCGKTAAVYACADELDWEVFEVYPGIGKRNAASLDNLVGDVGKNHLVRRSQANRSAQAHTGTAFTKFTLKTNGRVEAKATEKLPEEETKEGLVTTPPEAVCVNDSDRPTDKPGKPSGFRQSMVLLEEVDILFKEDTGFWPAVVNLIKDCKRPLVMTCSDISLIPTGDLPLQTVLVFDSCPAPLAVSYLQCLCVAEGYLVKREELDSLYQSTYELSMASDTAIDLLNVELPKPDLRRTINNLQFWCSRVQGSPPVQVPNQENDLVDEDMINWDSLGTETLIQENIRRYTQHAELASFVDSLLTRGALEVSFSHKSITSLTLTWIDEHRHLNPQPMTKLAIQSFLRHIHRAWLV
jgi:hypothetical protein